MIFRDLVLKRIKILLRTVRRLCLSEILLRTVQRLCLPEIPLRTVRRLCLTVCVAMFYSCDSGPDLKIEDVDDYIVIDGWIEAGDQAKIFVTRNSPYFSSIDSSSLRDLVLSRARASLENESGEEVLILRKDSRYFPPFYYEGNTIYGRAGEMYTLTVSYGGMTAVAHTTIPKPVEIDTVYFDLLENEDSLGNVLIQFIDPPEEKNYYRIFTKVLGDDKRFISPFLMAINDQYFPGDTVSLSLSRAPASFLSTEGSGYFEIDDTIVVKLSTMDEASFDFWNTYQEEVINSTNPFASSLLNLKSNVSGQGLGIFSGYGVFLDTIYP